jgi:pimeloyl-ACP methyl ester carboxylesterase
MAAVDIDEGVDGRLTLRDGRTLAYHEWGVPDGIPVLRLQGTPGSRFSRHAKPEIWQRLGVRVIMADRPGYGASPRMPGRSITSVADDLVELLDHLSIDRLPVVGGSGGGPHVLAVAARHPQRVSAASVIVGGAQITEEDIPLLVGVNAESVRRIRDGGWDAEFPLLADLREKILADPLGGFRAVMHDAPPQDQAVMSDPVWQETFKKSITEALRPGAEGWCDEAVALHAWDIAPEDVGVHIVWWHSRHDANVPLQAAQRVVERLPSADLRIWEGGHMETFHREEEIMRNLLGRADTR